MYVNTVKDKWKMVKIEERTRKLCNSGCKRSGQTARARKFGSFARDEDSGSICFAVVADNERIQLTARIVQGRRDCAEHTRVHDWIAATVGDVNGERIQWCEAIR